ncbi:MAG: SemiSWEET transporter [Methylotenera sp.]|jgi:MtN3 and saliva related transmembrane protein|nr:SemiSWEET transporter [Methylophilus sp.]MDP3609164.1 SemiSWEET transporter [Methylophilus sp.]MDZ4213026.1 SemiSWEET transporter [Methylotenera sp.]
MFLSEYASYIGTVGATLTTVSFVPQVIHSYRTRDLSGVSLSMYSIFTLGVGLWLVYGLLKQDWPLIVANSITFCLATIVIVLKVQQLLKK